MFLKHLGHSSLFSLEDSDENGMNVSKDTGDMEQCQRLEERKFDMGDVLLFGPESTEEHDRVPIGDYDTK